MNFKVKKAAIFGIDARIGLVLLSIASLAIALNKQALFESNRIKEVNINLLEAEAAIMQDYKDNYKKAKFITKDYNTTMTDAEKKAMWQGKTELYKDPWGNDWGLKVFTSTDTNLTAFGEKIEPVCIVIFSAGADGYDYKFQNYTAANYDDCVNNVGLSNAATETELSDDYFYKFTTIGHEVDINQDLVKRLDTVKNALFNYKESEKNIRIAYCNGLAQAVANSDAKCDVDISGVYDETELSTVNFFPKSTGDSSGANYGSVIVYDTVLAGMESLVIELGLAKSYTHDLAKRQLTYDSNVTGSTTGNYEASVYYKAM